MLDLMVDKRGGARQGFPQEAAAEIIRLGNYLRTAQSQATKINVWDNVPEYKKIEIERLGYSLTPQGFLKAVDNDNKDAVHVFLSSGIDLEVKDERGWTPLMIAAANGNQAFTLLLVHCGARLVARDVNGFNAFALGRVQRYVRSH
ncbi:MAG: ankyrin repeat domain-containing protein [Nitrosomonadales bacterium]